MAQVQIESMAEQAVKKYGGYYKCLRCPYKGVKSYATNHVLKKHLSQQEVPFLCRACEGRFASKEAAEEHLAKKHSKMSFAEIYTGVLQDVDLIAKYTTRMPLIDAKKYWQQRKMLTTPSTTSEDTIIQPDVTPAPSPCPNQATSKTKEPWTYSTLLAAAQKGELSQEEFTKAMLSLPPPPTITTKPKKKCFTTTPPDAGREELPKETSDTNPANHDPIPVNPSPVACTMSSQTTSDASDVSLDEDIIELPDDDIIDDAEEEQVPDDVDIELPTSPSKPLDLSRKRPIPPLMDLQVAVPIKKARVDREVQTIAATCKDSTVAEAMQTSLDKIVASNHELAQELKTLTRSLNIQATTFSDILKTLRGPVSGYHSSPLHPSRRVMNTENRRPITSRQNYHVHRK